MSALPNFLRHSSPDEPGYSRCRRGKGFSYHHPDGARVDDVSTLDRIKSLGLPPAYEDVWICRHDHGHLQAVGTDERGRRQYRYHPDWRAFRDAQKFDGLESFGRGLPRLRKQVTRDLRRNRPDPDYVTAALVRLIDQAALRVGSERYAQENGSFGATTLRSRHVEPNGGRLKLDFKSKGGRRVRQQIADRTLARVLERIGDLPGKQLFTALDEDGDPRPILSDDVNRYISEAMEADAVTAKTFRTWHGTLSALNAAATDPEALTIRQLSEAAAQRLHNTPAIARSSYIHPAVIGLAEMDREVRIETLDAIDLRRAPNDLDAEEKRLIAFLADAD